MAAALTAAVTVGAATAAVVIEIVRQRTVRGAFLIYHNGEGLERFQNAREFPGLVWNHFKIRHFPLHPAPAFTIQ
jgi:hypothetical protein